ncbi:MAG: hypothetical protein J1E43_04690 [Christensenellaceae bacterium]|nr:hypothetical protein [Christensenellaceae bacterium]
MKRLILPMAAVLLVTLLLPWLAMTFIPGDAGMAACFALFYAVNPLVSAGMGALAGIRRQWYWPAAMAGMFLIGARRIFAPGETAFLLYAGVYLAIGWLVMAAARLIRKS